VSAGSGYFIAHTGSAPSLGTGFGRSFFGWVLGCVRTGLPGFGNRLRLWFLASSLSGFGGINHIASGSVSAGGSVVGLVSGKFVQVPGAAPPLNVASRRTSRLMVLGPRPGCPEVFRLFSQARFGSTDLKPGGFPAIH
jgi:hypothetical protein